MSAPRNLAASVHGRLLTLARQRREELEYLLTRYALERLLYRVGASPHAGWFVLKGSASGAGGRANTLAHELRTIQFHMAQRPQSLRPCT